MKYANFSFYSTAAKTAIYALAASLLFACGASTPTRDLAQQDVAPQIQPTDQYLPVDQFDKEGNKLPYIAAENPYALQTGRIKKESVDLYIKARRAFKSEKYDQAESYLKDLVAQDKSLSGPWAMLGDIAMKRNKVSEAEEYFRKAIDINPENVNAYLRLGQALRVEGRFIQAQNVYEETLALWKDFPEAHLNLGILYDIYLNEPLAGQQHLEAYQFLTDSKNLQVDDWLVEIRSRTGVEYSIKAGPGAEQPAVSIAGGVDK